MRMPTRNLLDIKSPIQVQARALFGALSPGRPSLVSFRIMEDGLIAYEATKVDLMPKGPRGQK